MFPLVGEPVHDLPAERQPGAFTGAPIPNRGVAGLVKKVGMAFGWSKRDYKRLKTTTKDYRRPASPLLAWVAERCHG